MKTRMCNRCRKRKSIDQFYRAKKNGRILDSYVVWCKRCLGEHRKEYRASQEGKKHEAEYRKSDSRREVLARYNISEKRKKTTKRYMQTNKYIAYRERIESDPIWPKKQKARHDAQVALRRGYIQRGKCEYFHLWNCHGRMEMHHDNYDRPLEIRWLCSRHHKFVNKGTLP